MSTTATDRHLTNRPWLLALVFVVVTFAAYQSVWRAGFIWDDDDHLTANPAMTAPHGLRMIWSSLAVSRYYPLTLTTFWVERRLWGLNSMPYHWVNIALHAINGILIYSVLRRLRVPAAWFAAMLWVLHPVNVDSVAWITELKNTQSGVFFFLALLCFLRFEADEKRRWYWLSLLCGLAAMLSKPSTVVLPLCLLLCVWWERGRWRRADMVRVAPFFGLALGMSAVAVIEQRGQILAEGIGEWKLGIAERFVIAGKAIWFYAAKLLWPVKLVFVYPRWQEQGSSFSSGLPLAALVAAGIFLWIWRRQCWSRAVLFAAGFFVAALLPVLGIFDVYYFRYSFVADHFQYLASVGLIALAASAGTRICEQTGRLGRQIGTVAAPAILVVLGALTWRHGCTYRDVETLWRDTLTKNPSAWIAHNELGIILQDLGRAAEAKEQFEQVLRIKPDYAEAHNNLGIALVREGRVPEALGQLEQALRLKPDYAEAHYNLGLALARAGKLEDAIRHYRQAVRINPGFVEAHNNLGNALVQTGKPEEAVGHLEQALRIKPDSAEAHTNLGDALVRLGRVPEALGHLEQALRLRPDYAEAHYNLGLALWQTGKTQEAIEHYEQALRLKPDYAEAHNNLGLALWKTGQVREAIEHWEQALRLKPDYAAAHYNWGLALEQDGRMQEAIEHYEQALRLKPDYAKAQNRLARLRAAQ